MNKQTAGDTERSVGLPQIAGRTMRVLFVSSEIYPLAKTGGLADVSAALPRALAQLGVDVHLVMPGYPRALLDAVDRKIEAELPAVGDEGTTWLVSARMPDSGLPVTIVACPALFEREGNLYQDDDGHDWSDNARRFAHFSRVAARIATGEFGRRADVVHANDWHTGLLPILLDGGSGERPGTVFTIHNLAFQGLFPPSQVNHLGFADSLFTPDGFEFHGRVSFLKAGIRFADRLTTVSPTYAQEILTPDYGCGLDGLLRGRAGDLTGILNGVDYAVWDPSGDPHLPATFRPDDLSGKHLCKSHLRRELGLAAAPEVPLIVWISRITHQKMADVALDILAQVLDRNVQVAILGQGDTDLESRFRALAGQHPGRMAVRISYEEPLAHRLYAAGDILLHPARFEPCGLTPLYALRYGTIPIVRSVGGLVDTIVDANDETIRDGSATGFGFAPEDGCAMLDCIDRALAVFAQPTVWRKMVYRGMTKDFSWGASARRYLAVYRELAPHATLDAEAQAEELSARIEAEVSTSKAAAA